MFTLPTSMPRFKCIIFLIKIALKLSYFCKKMKHFRALWAPPSDPVHPEAGGFASRPPKQPPIANFRPYVPASVQNSLAKSFRIGLLWLSASTYEATVSTATALVSHLERF